MKRRNGFTLIELVVVVVIIAIIAAIAIPKMSRGSAGAADSATTQDLATLRSALELYQTEHGGTYPSGAAVTAQLTQYTDSTGATVTTKDSTHIYGPYLKAVPSLPVGTNKGFSTITNTGPAGTGTFGWYYDGAGNIVVNDPVGDTDTRSVAYNTY